ncbi:type II toxin-antitoxin system death-on-curing family toxin [Effusibacillus lacus]|uniref:Death-on-curing family protein n=1 Tax=Effusibacillus lacus TaxID=1348429 RepID=A0A292YMI0_9BACL|nr:type II toxin-antitoxin system death-on-curing family toxin [Effusibacillus lacus]TCS76598.1 death-on-curing protein [Effusibacillus lacus]GAX90386.1 death-on-curing family protein [Effusibacillus lacus]
MVYYLTAEEVLAINLHVIRTISPHEQKGVKFPHLLESAVNRPRQSAVGEDAYPTIFEKATALFESLAQNHAFHNANKRTAFLALLQFLNYNGYEFKMSKKKAEDFTVDVVNHVYSFQQIAAIIQEHTVPM